MARFTNFPNGITSLGIPTFGTGSLPPYTGNYFWVKETTTAGTSAGKGTVESPYNTLEQALAVCTSGNNDVVFMVGTIHPLDTIVWSKSNTHLVGVCAPLKRGKRARISVTGSTAYGPLVSVTGNGCHFTNFGTFFGWAVTGSTSPICWRDTGGRNVYNNVELLGFGDSTVTTGTANQTGARSYTLNTSTGECTFRDCVFGVDTINRGAANYNVEIAGGAPRVTFENCDFEAICAAGGAGGGWLLIGSAGIDRYLNFKDCLFMNSVNSTGTALTQGFNINGSAGGMVNLIDSPWMGATHAETSASGVLRSNMPVFDAADAGLLTGVTP